MVSHPETGSDSPIGSDRDRGRDSNSPKQFMGPSDMNCWTIFPTQFFGQLSNKIIIFNNFTKEFIVWTTLRFIFHALTLIILGCPGAYGMHYAISNNSC